MSDTIEYGPLCRSCLRPIRIPRSSDPRRAAPRPHEFCEDCERALLAEDWKTLRRRWVSGPTRSPRADLELVNAYLDDLLAEELWRSGLHDYGPQERLCDGDNLREWPAAPTLKGVPTHYAMRASVRRFALDTVRPGTPAGPWPMNDCLEGYVQQWPLPLGTRALAALVDRWFMPDNQAPFIGWEPLGRALHSAAPADSHIGLVVDRRIRKEKNPRTVQELGEWLESPPSEPIVRLFGLARASVERGAPMWIFDTPLVDVPRYVGCAANMRVGVNMAVQLERWYNGTLLGMPVGEPGQKPSEDYQKYRDDPELLRADVHAESRRLRAAGVLRPTQKKVARSLNMPPSTLRMLLKELLRLDWDGVLTEADDT